MTISALDRPAAAPSVPAGPDPRMIYLELFAACDMSCPMCVTLPYWEGKRRMMSRQHIRERILEPAAARRMERVIVGGGEPSLRKDFFDILGDISDLGLRIWLATNLLRYDDAKLTTLLQRLDGGAHTVAVSYDSAIPEEMNAIRGGQVFEPVDTNCRRLAALRRELGSDVTFCATMIVQAENVGSVQATIDHTLETVGFDFIHVYPRHDYKSVTLENYQEQRPSEWCRQHEVELIRTGIQLYDRARRDRRIVVMGSLDDWVQFVRSPQKIKRRCDAKRFLFFNAEGKIRTCMFGAEYADIRSASMEQVVGSDAYKEARRFLDACRICHLSSG